ncbi:hypothetical protein [Sandarakinorhabdus sp. DWP1-3-1]|uniref:hypothetical protein n=1 Tax=Sandarakinorhabdus sp. DWP1-3-1 TaxID=2804627 RepID=UPI003CEE4063
MVAKPVADFGRDRTRADGLAYTCRGCVVEVNRAAYERRRVAGKVASRAKPRAIPAESGRKVCRVCGEAHPLWMFGRDSSRADGLDGRCRNCEAERSAARYAARIGTAGPRPRKHLPPVSAPVAAVAVPPSEAAAKQAARAAERAANAAARDAASKVVLAAMTERANAAAAARESRRVQQPPSAAAQVRLVALLAAAEASKGATLPG